MSGELMQFGSENHVLGNANIVEALVTDRDIVFSKSYIVVGEVFKAGRIRAIYDLDVMTDVYAKSISVNGDLLVKGDIEADELTCHGAFICTGKVRVKKLNLESYAMTGSVVGEELYSGGNLFVRTTVDTGVSFESEGLVVAGEGILGTGSFNANAAIANDYFEFNGRSKSKVFEISEMDFSFAGPDKKQVNESKNMDIVDIVNLYNNTITKSLNEWSRLDEKELTVRLHKMALPMCDLHFVNYIMDRIIGLLQGCEVVNFRDYLYILCAKNIFPKELTNYKAIEPVLEDMFNEIAPKVDNMEYKAGNIDEFSCSLHILDIYQDQLPISVVEGADKIFSSIGLRYSTVEHAWRKYNG